MTPNTKSSRGLRLHFAAALLIGTASAALLATPAEAQVSAASLRGTITDNGEATATSVTIVEIATGYRSTPPVSSNGQKIGRASWMDTVVQDVEITVESVSS